MEADAVYILQNIWKKIISYFSKVFVSDMITLKYFYFFFPIYMNFV